MSRAWRGAGGLRLVPGPSWAEPWAVWVELGGPTGGQNRITVPTLALPLPGYPLCLASPGCLLSLLRSHLIGGAAPTSWYESHPLHSLFLLPWLFLGPFPGPVLSWLPAQVQVPKSDCTLSLHL